MTLILRLAICLAVFYSTAAPTAYCEKILLRTPSSSMTISLSGGCIAGFQLNDSNPVNPLSWTSMPLAGGETDQEQRVRVGHFMCLDRWGAPSDAEARHGMPFHGEASLVSWTLERQPQETDSGATATMFCELPMAGLRVHRQIVLDANVAVARIVETISNTRPLGRIYNLVQHPTIAPPFLDENTVIDCNAGQGIHVNAPWPNVESTSFTWPMARDNAGSTDDLRHLVGPPDPNVASFVFPASVEFGWTTASSPTQKLLLGYLWKVEDYPWFNAWRHWGDGKPAARGLEFGTTGLHRPFRELVSNNLVFDKPVFEWIDAGETIKKSYLAFLAKIPANYQGVTDVRYDGKTLRLIERNTSSTIEIVTSMHDPGHGQSTGQKES